MAVPTGARARAEIALIAARAPFEPVRLAPAKEERNGAMTPTQNEIHPKHSYSPIRKDGLEVPETEIRIDDSPSGPNCYGALFGSAVGSIR